MATAPPDEITVGPIQLRRRTLADAEDMVAAVRASLDHLRPWMPWAAAEPSIQIQQKVIAGADTGWLDGSEFAYALYEIASGKLVGGAGLHRRVGPRAIEIGYWVRVDRIRQGYAKLAAAALTRTGMALDTVDHVEIHCDEANVASAAVPRSLGYRLDRVENDELQSAGDSGRSMVWVLAAKDLPGSPFGQLGT